MKKVGIVIKPDVRAIETADRLEKWFSSKQIDVLKKEFSMPDRKLSDEGIQTAPPDLFCVFVLGGDGTFLSAARWIGDQDIPILGVKFGEVGFLAETVEDNLFPVAENIIKNNFSTSTRMRLFVEVVRNDKVITRETVLNDMVINKGALARLAHIDTYINDTFLTTYRGDGLIIATPTGSTAYSLAAGGPIVHPEVPAFIMTPICPFTLTNRPLILPDTVCINIRFAKKSKDLMLTFDGQEGFEIRHDDTVIVKKGLHPVNMINVPGQQYFDVLKAKLRWSGSRI